MASETVQVDFTAEYAYYSYRRVEGGGEECYLFGTYRPVVFARCARTRQECVVYVGITGPEAGQHLHCPLYDFHMKFNKIEEKTDTEGSLRQEGSSGGVI